jgi:hypothetical protein
MRLGPDSATRTRAAANATIGAVTAVQVVRPDALDPEQFGQVRHSRLGDLGRLEPTARLQQGPGQVQPGLCRQRPLGVLVQQGDGASQILRGPARITQGGSHGGARGEHARDGRRRRGDTRIGHCPVPDHQGCGRVDVLQHAGQIGTGLGPLQRPDAVR